MRLAVYILLVALSIALLVFGAVGSLGNAVSYKYEAEDPIVEMHFDKLPEAEQQTARLQLEEKEKEIELLYFFLTGIIIFSMVSLILLLIYRKRILAINERPMIKS